MRKDFVPSHSRHAGEEEPLDGGFLQHDLPDLSPWDGSAFSGSAIVNPAMVNNRWKTLYGGLPVALAEECATYGAIRLAQNGETVRFQRIDYTFFGAVRQKDVPNPLFLRWTLLQSGVQEIRVGFETIRRVVLEVVLDLLLPAGNPVRELGMAQVEFLLVPEGSPHAELSIGARVERYRSTRPKQVVLPAYNGVSDTMLEAGTTKISGFWNSPMPFTCSIDSTFAAALNLQRGDGLPDHVREDLVVYRYSYVAVDPNQLVGVGQYRAVVEHVGSKTRGVPGSSERRVLDATVATVRSEILSSISGKAVGIAVGTLHLSFGRS